MNMQTLNNEFSALNARFDSGGDLAVYKTLLESTNAIPWKIDWATMQFSYIGPQIEPLLGWAQDSWKTVEDWSSRMHEDDREFAVNYCVSQSVAGLDHEMDYRALTKDNGYVWIRDVIHVVRNDAGEVDCLIGFMFDISERKKIEQELVSLQEKLERLSYEDGLTGLSNRRMFDKYLADEWANVGDATKPLSLIMLDIDHFKQYNDFYGHLQGDECLKSVAAALKTVAKNDRDIVARFGGEEFVLLLPGTNDAEAVAVANECLNQIAALKLPHEKSATSPHVTASVGVKTIVPPAGMVPSDFVKSVDKLLYTAKNTGRNTVVSSGAI
ncbi:GGDEF domain-containing protein [Sphingorhabdus arenilitoris]|uniref:diguanylate cyclase n=1 Tax=Sphingorhabdus arenilitoris TaxID=1490041 RepID=A0ABV8RBU4_9SPHN